MSKLLAMLLAQEGPEEWLANFENAFPPKQNYPTVTCPLCLPLQALSQQTFAKFTHLGILWEIGALRPKPSQAHL